MGISSQLIVLTVIFSNQALSPAMDTQVKAPQVQSLTEQEQSTADDAKEFQQNLLFTALITPPSLLVGLASGAGVWFLGQGLATSALLTVIGGVGISLVAGALLGLEFGAMYYAVSAIAQIPLILLDPVFDTKAQVEKENNENFWTYIVAIPVVTGLGLAVLGGLGAVAVQGSAALPIYWGGLAVFSGLVSGAMCAGVLWDPLEDFVE